MIKRIRCKNFESHSDTEMFFGDGFNCVFGESNVGKSSGVIRTLKLVAYNQFDKKMVRIGAKHLEVEVETDKGIVRVCRGEEINEWWVTKNGITEHLVKPGSKPIPQAIEVLGFGPVSIGDTKIEAHLMDQLEAHFLISAIGSEKTSGSGRAQVIDDISGLRGAEKLIQDIALDMSKLNRAEKEDSERINDLSQQVIPELVLASEESLVKLNEDRLLEVDLCMSKVSAMIRMAQSYSSTTKSIGELTNKVSGLIIPDLDDLCDSVRKLVSLNKLKLRYGEVNSSLEALNKSNKNIPDLVELEDLSRKIVSISKVKRRYDEAVEALGRIGSFNSNIPSVTDIEDVVARVLSVRRMIGEYKKITSGLQVVNSELLLLQQDLEQGEKKLKETMLLVTICPITGKPIDGSCLNEKS